VLPPADACELALAAADAVGGDLVGVDLLPAGVGTWTVIEVNGAVDFTGAYALGDEIFAAVRSGLEQGRYRRSVGAGNRAAAERVGTWTSRLQSNATTRTSSTRAR
jgi:hypothetical protein